MNRVEPVLVALYFASWIGALLGQWGVLSLAGTLPMGLYPYYSIAAFLGWSMGNLYLVRRRQVPGRLRRRLLLVSVVGPPGILYLLRSMAPQAAQQLAPLVPLFAFGVFAVFFTVPVALSGQPASRPRIGG